MKEKNVIVITFLFAVLSCLAISFADTTLVPRAIPSIIALLRYILALFAGGYMLKNKLVISGTSKYRIFIISVVFLLSIFHTYKGDIDILKIISFMPMFIFCMLKDHIYIQAFLLFRKLMVWVSAISIIIYADYIFGLGIPHTIAEYYGTRGFYVNYYLSYIYVEDVTIRSCGFFNEPGYFGTVLALVLIASRLELRKFENVIMFVAGILTISMAFWVLIFIAYFILLLKNWKNRLIAALFVGSFFYIINNVEFSNPVVSHMVERMQYDSKEGKFKGDNRSTDYFDQIYNKFEESSNTLFGYGSGYFESLEMQGVAIYKSQILDWGYVGFTITYGLLIFCVFIISRKNRNALVLVSCFTISIYQRPNVFAFVYILVLFGGVLYLKSNAGYMPCNAEPLRKLDE